MSGNHGHCPDMIYSDILKELGEIHENWFEELTEGCKNYTSSSHINTDHGFPHKHADPGRTETSPGKVAEQAIWDSNETPLVPSSRSGGTSKSHGIVTPRVDMPTRDDVPSPSTPGPSGYAPNIPKRQKRTSLDKKHSPINAGSKRLESKSTSHDAAKKRETNTSVCPQAPQNKGTPNLKNTILPMSSISTSTPKLNAVLKKNVDLASPVLIESPAAGIVSKGCSRGKTIPTVETPRFSTPRFSPWLNKGDDRKPVSDTQESSEDLDNMLARALDSDDHEHILTGSHGSTLILSGNLGDNSEQTIKSTTSMRSEKGFLREFSVKTPGSVKLANIGRLKEALGVDPLNSGASWTSSLATPPRDMDGTTGRLLAEKSPVEIQELPLKGAARKLFSPEVCDIDCDEMVLNSTAEDTPTRADIEDPVKQDNLNNNDKCVTLLGKEENSEHNLEKLSVDGKETGGEGNSPAALKGKIPSKLQRSLTIISDIIGTPPSRTSVRRPPPRRRVSKRHSLPSTSSASKLLENIMTETLEDPNKTIGALPKELDSDMTLNKDLPTTGSGNCGVEDNTRKSEVKRHGRGSAIKECEELEFTQLSPSSLNAICDAVTQSEHLNESKNLSGKMEETQIPGAEIQSNTRLSNAENKGNSPEIISDVHDKMPVTPVRGDVKDHEPNDFLFSQISPSAMDSIFSATESASIVAPVNIIGEESSIGKDIDRPMTRISDSSKECQLEMGSRVSVSPETEIQQSSHSNTSTEQNKIDHRLPPGKSMASITSAKTPKNEPSMGNQPQSSVGKIRTMGLRRRPGRFLYPTSNQITNVCPKKVINFEQATNSHKEENQKQSSAKLDQHSELVPNTENITVPPVIPSDTTGQQVQTVERQYNVSSKKPTVKKIYSTGFTPLSAYQRPDSPPSSEPSPKNKIPSQKSVMMDKNRSNDLITALSSEAPTLNHVSPKESPGNEYLQYLSLTAAKVREETEEIMSGMEDEFEREFNVTLDMYEITNVDDLIQSSPSINNAVNDVSEVTGPVTKRVVNLDDALATQPKFEPDEQLSVPEKCGSFKNSNQTLETSDAPCSDSTGFVGFRSASGKNIDLKENDFKKYAKWFEEETPVKTNSESALIAKVNSSYVKQHSKAQTDGMDCGFDVSSKANMDSSAGKINKLGTNVEKPSSLEGRLDQDVKSPMLMDKDEILMNDRNDTNLIEKTETEEVPPFIGFKTAAGNELKIEESKYAVYGKWFEEDMPIEGTTQQGPMRNNDEKSGTKDGITPVVGSETVIGHKVGDKEKDVAKDIKDSREGNIDVKDLCTEDGALPEEENKVMSKSGEDISNDNLGHLGGFIGFKTAGGKQFEIDDSKLSKYEKWFEEDRGEDILEKKATPKKYQSHSLLAAATFEEKDMAMPQSESVGFKTAAGKHLDVDSKLVTKFSEWFDEEETHAPEENNPEMKCDPPVIEKKAITAQIPTIKKTAVEKDYSKVPKGYRPYKRPRMISKTMDKEEIVRPAVISCNKRSMETEDSIKKVQNVQNAEHQETDTGQGGSSTGVEQDEFNDSFDKFTYTQISEATNCAEALVRGNASLSLDSPKKAQNSNVGRNEIWAPLPRFKESYGGESGTSGPFSTASGKAINVSEAASLKVKDLFTEEGSEAPSRDGKISMNAPSTEGNETVLAEIDIKPQNPNESKAGKAESLRPTPKTSEMRENENGTGRNASVSHKLMGNSTGEKKTVGGNLVDTLETAAGKMKPPPTDNEGTPNSGLQCTSEQLEAEVTQSGSFVENSSYHQIDLNVPQLNLEHSTQGPFTKKLRPQEERHSRSQGQFLSSSESSVFHQSISFYTGEKMRGVSFLADACGDAIVPVSQEIRREEGSKSSVIKDNCDDSRRSFISDTQNACLDDGSTIVPAGHVLGFKTAAGISVKISSNALQNAQRLLADTQDDTTLQPQDDDHLKNLSKKEIERREERNVVNPERRYFDKITDSELSNMTENTSNICHDESSKLAPPGFKTAAGKTVKISSKALQNAQQLLAEAEDEPRVQTEVEHHKNDLAKRKIEHGVIENDLGAEKRNIDKITDSGLCNMSENTPNAVVPAGHVLGFKTAAGKSVKISSKALQNAQILLADSQDDTTLQPQVDSFQNDLSKKQKAHGDVTNELGSEKRNLDDLTDSELCNFTEITRKTWDEDSSTTEPSGFVLGFKTAAGTTVKISTKALHNAQKLLAETQEDASLQAKVDEKSDSVKQTGLEGAQPCLSDGAKDNPEIRFKDDHPTQETKASLKPSSGLPSNSEPNFVGFLTAAGKSVKVSEKALKNAQKLLSEDENSVGAHVESEHVEKDKSKGHILQSTVSGFTTATGKVVSVSEKALIEAKSMLHVEESHTNPGLRKEAKIGSVCNVFATASGKPVEVTEKALTGAKELLKEGGHVKGNDASLIENKLTNPQSMKFKGFVSASGKSVQVSEQALRKAQKVLSEENVGEGYPSAENEKIKLSSTGDADTRGTCGDRSPERSEPDDERVIPENKITQPSFVGFLTAWGKSVSVSDSSLQQVQKLFSDDFTSSSPNNKPTKKVPEGSTSGKDVDQSLESSSKNTLNVLNKDTPRINLEKGHAISGFSTAGGKSVTVSQSALDQAKLVLESGTEDTGHIDTHRDKVKETGMNTKCDVFATASGKQVTVSEKALNDVVNASGHVDEKRGGHSSNFSGFSTASGQSVSVSEGALNKAKELLADDDKPCILEASKVVEVEDSEKVLKQGKNILTQDKSWSSKRSSEESIYNGRRQGPTTQDTLYEEDHDVMNEVSESSKALLADGDETFGEESTFSSSGLEHQKLIYTPVAQHGNQQNSILSASARKSTSRISTMKPVSSTPESFLSDRCPAGQSLSLKPLVSAPDKDVRNVKMGNNYSVHSWQGPTSYKDFTNPLADDRPGTSITPSNQYLRATISRPVSQSTPVKYKSDSNFTTPYRKPCNDQPSSFKPPVKSSTPGGNASSGSFKTPLKSTPGKRTASEADFISPLQKRSRVEESGDHNTSEMGKLIEDEFMIDWEHEQDSIAEALSTTDFENLEKNSNICPTEENIKEPSENPKPESTGKASVKISVSDAVAKARMKAKVVQAQRIRMKKEKGGVKPQPGAWYSHRTANRGINLKSAVGGLTPQFYSRQELYCFGVRESVVSICASSAEGFRFSAGDFYDDTVSHQSESVRVGDGAVLLWDDSSTAGKEEFCNALLDLDGVDPKLTSRDWIYNHYRWIVWKLAAMETTFPQVFGGRCLTPDRVMLQLKYRYDREVDNSQRSAVKKIFERDDTPAKVLVLCISAIVSLPQNVGSSFTPAPKVSTGAGDGQEKKPVLNTAVLELTDGWYPIKAILDVALSRLVSSKRLRVGDKLVMYGAELVGSQEAAPPLQAPGDTMLKISANSCRRCCWYTKMGYHSNPQPVPLPLSSLYSDGGNISCVDVVVTRVYPLQYMERIPTGGTVFRSDRAEQRIATKFDNTRQKQLENIYGKIQTEFEKRASGTGRRSSRTGRRFSVQEVTNFSSGQEIYEALQASTDQASLEASLSQHQMALLTDHQRLKQEELHSEMQAEFRAKLEEFEEKNPKRNVTPLLKLRVAGCSNRDVDSKTNTVLTIWRPSDDIMEMLTEGKRLCIYHLSAGESRGRLKGNAVALTAQRMTRYRNVPVDDNFLDLVYEPREVAEYNEFKFNFHPPYDEVDCVGLVVLASAVSSFDRASGDEGQVQTVYMADADGNLLAVKVWGGTAAYGLDELLKVNIFVAMSNLSWRSDATGRARLPTVTITEASLVTTNPKEPHLRTALEQLKAKIKSINVFVDEMKEKLHSVMTNTPTPVANAPQLNPRMMQGPNLMKTPRSRMNPGLATPRSVVYPQSNPRPSGSQTSDHRSDLPGVGLTPRSGSPFTESFAGQTPASEDVEEVDPVVAKKRALQRLKSQKLLQVSDQTPVTPLYSSVPAKVRRAFKMPAMARSDSPSLDEVNPSRKVGGKPTDGSPAPRVEKLYRKLNFAEHDNAVGVLNIENCDTMKHNIKDREDEAAEKVEDQSLDPPVQHQQPKCDNVSSYKDQESTATGIAEPTTSETHPSRDSKNDEGLITKDNSGETKTENIEERCLELESTPQNTQTKQHGKRRRSDSGDIHGDKPKKRTSLRSSHRR